MRASDHRRVEASPPADPAAMVDARPARFTVLTSRLLRLEFAADERFEDRPSRSFWHRRQPVPGFEVSRIGDVVEKLGGRTGDGEADHRTEERIFILAEHATHAGDSHALDHIVAVVERPQPCLQRRKTRRDLLGISDVTDHSREARLMPHAG